MKKEERTQKEEDSRKEEHHRRRKEAVQRETCREDGRDIMLLGHHVCIRMTQVAQDT